MKKILIALFLIIPIHSDAQKCPHPKSTIFLWDMHDVILTRDTKKIIKLIYAYPHKTKLIFSYLMFDLLAFVWNTIFEEAYTETLIKKGFDQNQPEFAQLVINIANAQKPINETVEIIQELYDLGYIHHLGSNVAYSAYKDLTDTQKYPKLAHIFKLFDLSKSHPVRYIDNTLMPRKPEKSYFYTYLKKNEIDISCTRVIFIDDKLANVKAAESVGMVGIQFISPERLRSDLKKLGFELVKKIDNTPAINLIK